MTLAVETVGDAVVLTIDRPEVKNAISRDLARRIGEAIRAAARDPRARGIVLAAAGGGTFLSGGDLNELGAAVRRGEGGGEVLAMLDDLSLLESCEIPVIAAVSGDVFGGGCELLLLCDLVVLEEHAHIAFRHAKMGLSPAWGGITRLLERVGSIEAARLLFTAEKVGAAEALRLGLANEVVATGTARARAIARVNRIADNPRAAVAAIKLALFESRQARRGDAIERERRVFAELWGAAAHRHAIDEFFARK